MPDAAPPETFADGFVPIAFVYSRPEAAVLEATLRAYGIAAFVRNEGHVAVQTPLLVALGGLCVAVAPEQLDDAIALLHAIDEGWTRPKSPLALRRPLRAAGTILTFLLLFAPPTPRIRGEYLWRIRES
jgi:hypothetical protein